MQENRRSLEEDARTGHGFPFPYPTTQEHLLGDLRHQLGEILSPDHKSVGEFPSKEMQEILTAWDNEGLDFRTVAIENWMPWRCSPDSDFSQLLLVVASNKTEGSDVMRAVLGLDGQLVSWTALEAADSSRSQTNRESPSAELSRKSEELRAAMRTEAHDVQFAAIEIRNGFGCPLDNPCVVARSGGGDVFLISSTNDVYRFEIEKRHIPLRDVVLGKQKLAESRAWATIGAQEVVSLAKVSP
jgi:hypothetical protein